MKQAAIYWNVTKGGRRGNLKGAWADLRDVVTGETLHSINYWPEFKNSVNTATDALAFQAQALGYALVVLDEEGNVLEAAE